MSEDRPESTDAAPEPDEAPVSAVREDGEYLIAIVFDKPGRASEVLVNVMNLAQEGAVKLSDAVVLTKGADGRGRVQQTVEITPGRGALIGGWLGLFAGLFVGPLAIAGGAAAGAIYGRLSDRGIDDGWIKQMAEWLEPGGSALLLLCSINDQPAMVRELRRYEGNLVTTDLPVWIRDEVEDALRDHLAEAPRPEAWTPPAG
ncbi:MAG: DUF1269 domain-containing protein [Acidimicrobiales bacterium]